MTINKDQLRKLIVETLKEVGLYSEAAVELLMGTAAVESNLGEYIEQINGPALGIFQMEPKTHNDIHNNYLYFKENSERFFIYTNTKLFTHGVLKYNIKYSIIMARLHYLRAPEQLPDMYDIDGLAYYWKRYFNTHLGKGKKSDFIEKYNKYVRG